MKLIDVINSQKGQENTQRNEKLNSVREKYKLACIKHWQDNKEKIIDYFASCPSIHGQTIFISYYAVIYGTPLHDIPLSKEAQTGYDDELPAAEHSLPFYFYALGINFKELGTTCYSTSDKDFEKRNGIEVDLNSDVQI